MMNIRILLLLQCAALLGCKPALRNDAVNEEGPLETPPVVQSSNPAIPDTPDSAPLKSPQFPLERTLHNPQGKAIKAEIIAKEGDFIAFRREADGKSFLISIFQLSIEDQLFLADLEDEGLERISAIREETRVSDAAPKGGTVPENRALLPREILWHESLESALAAAKGSGKKVMLVLTGDFDFNPTEFQVDYYSDSAEKNSDSLIRTVLKDTSFLGFVNNQFEAVHLSYFIAKEMTGDQHVEVEDLGKRWNLRVFPAVLILGTEGEVLARIDGYDRRGPNILREKLSGMMKE